MHLLEKSILHHIRLRQLLQPGHRLLLAVSGGPDSMALLAATHALRHLLRLDLAIAHCNFGLRGEESQLDETFVKQEAARRGITCHIRSFDTRREAVGSKRSIEETARLLRYRWFHELIREHGYDRMATAHHAGDNAETMLFNLVRGSSPSGLHGIRSHNGLIIRPMLHLRRSDITTYLHATATPSRHDSSNDTIDHDRNFIRHRVIPLFEQRFPHKLLPALQRLAEQAGELDDFLANHIDARCNQDPGLRLTNHRIATDSLRQLTPFEQKELFKRLLHQLGQSVDAAILQRLCQLIELQPGKTIDARNGFNVTRERHHLHFNISDPPFQE